MFERTVGSSILRFVGFLGLLSGALAACDRAETAIYGHVDVIPSGVREAACVAPDTGQLQLVGMQAADLLTISADELCHHWIVRKELPAGLYSVSWQPSQESDLPAWEVREAAIINVFPEQTTTLRVQMVEPDSEPLSQASSLDGVDPW